MTEKIAQPWGSSHSTHSGLEADWCGNCREEQRPKCSECGAPQYPRQKPANHFSTCSQYVKP